MEREDAGRDSVVGGQGQTMLGPSWLSPLPLSFFLGCQPVGGGEVYTEKVSLLG